ncbi:TonB-dependent receptor domain-containing protein [Chondromyces crocatus]|uniref:TonB C-terminal domain-containing protein n=1 Tax=Chondromyces crocatus TaxID=52 RepID=A0A0K1EMV8_CHOCO|nr:TonB-dependent receptor [Chondromyces crocatus]AKT41963.1 uncharacterized protein CMC5_061850 [Chondromyces crocatus]
MHRSEARQQRCRTPPSKPAGRLGVTACLLALLTTSASPALAQQPSPPASGSAPPASPTAAQAHADAPASPDGAKDQPTPPVAKNYVPPDYPPEARAAGKEATVTLQLDINRDGKVLRAVVVEPAGHGFDEAATAAAEKLDFEPARKPDGTPFAARILYRYTFSLEPEKPKDDPATEPREPGVSTQRLSGIVLAEGEIPLAGASVTLTPSQADASPLALTTDETGVFAFPTIPPGKYRLAITMPGFDPLEVLEEVAPGEQIEVKYRLLPVGDGLEVTVRGKRPPREVTKRTIEQRELLRIPGTNGDALRSLQNLPGVARPPAIAGILIVRGSSPQDTQTFIDGTPVPLIYHFGGLSSVVPTEMLEKIDFYPGNFGAQFGRGMGGIVDVALRSPKEDRIHGLAQVDLIDARVLVEGPVPFLKGVRFAAAGRRSYVDAWLGPALTAAGAGVTQAPVYYDYQFMLEADVTPSARLRLTYFGSDDALELLIDEPSPNEPALTGNIGLHTAFQRLQLRYDHELTDKDRLAGVIAFGKEDLDFGLGPFYFLLDNLSVSGRLEYTRRFFQGVTLNTGLDIVWNDATVNLRAPAPGRPGEPPNQPFSTRTVQELSVSNVLYRPAAYAELELVPTPRARLVPGLRVDYAKDTQQWTVSPRFSGRYDIVQGFPRTTAKGGVGMYHQPPQPQEVIPPLGSPNLRSNQAIHYSAGVEQEITRQVEVSGEMFYKQLDSLVIGTPQENGSGTEYKNLASGQVVGGEFLLKYKPDDRFFGWAAYTLSRATRTDRPGEPPRLLNFDQTHILTVLGSYRLGHGWEFGARFRLVSGNLTTPSVCNVQDVTCDPARTNALYHAPSGVYTPIPLTGPGSERLPIFHQLDLRIDKRWKFTNWQLSAYLDVQNVYNNQNTEGIQYNFNYTARQFVSGLPILPSIGMRGEF